MVQNIIFSIDFFIIFTKVQDQHKSNCDLNLHGIILEKNSIGLDFLKRA
jgi:hypothetical protein